MTTVHRHHEAASSLGLQVVLAHRAPALLAIHHYAFMPQRRPNPAVAIAFDRVADRADPGASGLEPNFCNETST